MGFRTEPCLSYSRGSIIAVAQISCSLVPYSVKALAYLLEFSPSRHVTGLSRPILIPSLQPNVSHISFRSRGAVENVARVQRFGLDNLSSWDADFLEEKHLRF